MKNLLIKNASVVNEGTVSLHDILIEGDVITRILPAHHAVKTEETRVIDATGLILFPGIIDDQVHFREPGLTQKGDIASESAAAAAGGLTSFMDMPNNIPQTITLEELERKNEIAAASSVINYTFYLGATNDNIEELRKADPTKVCGIKVFMGASTGNMLVDNPVALAAIFSIKKIPVACHCEEESVIRENLIAYREEYGDDLSPAFHPLIRSRKACFVSSSKAIAMANSLDTKLHILHLSTLEETSLFEARKTPSGKNITAEVCIHHLWFDDSSYATKGNLIKWNPAIKSDSDRQALREALRSGRLDIIATDHAPHTLEEKLNPYIKAPAGGPMVQHSLVVMMELYRQGVISLENIAAKMCHNPAIIFNIKGRGYIREGYKADIVLVNPDSPWTVTRENILYKCGWSPLEGTTFNSSIHTTIANGTVVYENGKLTGKRAAEKLLFER
jgi:dihydroorotase